MNNEKQLHIICYDVPYPPDYGGVIDLFYKIKALYEAGIRIKLHCFSYGRPPQDELKKFCEEVNYYDRTEGIKSLSLHTPYIVKSRDNSLLLQNLLKDDDPVLMEGVHSTVFLPELYARNRKIFLRLHNVETEYYRQLSRTETNPFKKLYLYTESGILKSYEKNLPPGLPVLAMTEKDADYYREKFGKQRVMYLPAFIPFTEVNVAEGMGNFCLYHGNLSVPENEKAAVWLIENVFSKARKPFVIAGRNPSSRLRKMARLSEHTCIVANPTDSELSDLIKKAHINVLPSFNNTGIKLKLIHALYIGRHCVVNPATIEGTGLEAACHSGENADAIASIISQLYHLPFAEEEISLRKRLLPAIFDSRKNAQKLIQWIW